MSQLEFEESSQSHLRKIDISNAITHNTPLLIKWGFAKNVQQANIIMLAVTVACVVAAIIIFITNSQRSSTLYKEDFTTVEITHMLPDIANSLPSKK